MSEREPTLGDVLAAVQALGGAVNRIGGEVAEVSGKVGALEGAFTALDGRFTALDGRFTALDVKADRLRVDLMTRMDGLENKITAIRDDIAVNHGTADQVRRANDNTREELRSLVEVVFNMERQILRLRTDMDERKNGKPS